VLLAGPGVPVDARVRFLERQTSTLTQELAARAAENAELRAQFGLADRVPASQIEHVPVKRKPASKWAEISDGRLREIIGSCASQMEALQLVGVAPAAKNYERLRREAQRLGVDLPGTHASLRKKVAE